MSRSGDIRLPPVIVLAARGHEQLLKTRLRDLRARGVRYKVIHLEKVLRPKGVKR
ncbi:MAG TPA: hypothetical protein PKY77_22150 [Phycisphaerae bacterium]|nr:hypothetical protein [Phycisphaerae bacterium]